MSVTPLVEYMQEANARLIVTCCMLRHYHVTVKTDSSVAAYFCTHLSMTVLFANGSCRLLGVHGTT